MRNAGVPIVLLLVALALTAAWIIAAPASAWLEAGWVVRGLVWLVALAVAATAALLAWRHGYGLLQQTRSYLTRLCELDYHELSSESAEVDLPCVPQSHLLAEPLLKVRDVLIERTRQLQEVEHARAALEIRSRRSAAQQERIAAILASLNEPVLVVDEYGDLLLANPSAQRLFDINSMPTERRALAELVRCEKLVELIQETRRRKGPLNRTDEVELPDALGAPQWYSVTASNICPSESEVEGEPEGTVAVLREISSQKAVQQRNAEFVSSVSHEMKTPLAGIKAYVELLADGDAEDEQTREECLHVINTQADRLQRLIDNLLNLARIEAGVVKVNKQPRALNELLEEAFRVLQPSAEQKRITLVSDLSPLYLGIFADRDMLLQAAINLLSNAIKYTPEEGRVILRSRLVDQEVLFEVEDSGVGLSEDDCQKVFEKFYRVKKNAEMAQGTGLGLALVKHIIEDVHNGRLQVTSKLGEGSTFSVYLPSARQLT